MSAVPTNAIRVLLIDDHVVMRTALRALIDSQPGLTVVGEAATRAEALLLAGRERPAIILLDLDLGNERGLTLLPELLDAASDARVIVLTGVRDVEEYRQAVQLGALGLVQKEQALDTLIHAIERVHAGDAWLAPRLVARVLSEPASTLPQVVAPDSSKLASLTNREREVVELICDGLKNKGIGERLCISEATVSHHLTSIFNKLGTTTRFELITYAYRHGLAQPH
jgi:DNA-binding NarL/FixJ family response regulator